ncbi:MAG: hypothetical protein ACYTBS_24705, partial [Planctomycetota bacterium]
SRKEVVIENDIAWRIHTMVDFLFGKPLKIRSLAEDPQTAEAVEKVASTLHESNGGIAFLQEIALLGNVYGFVDIALRTPAANSAAIRPSLSLAAEPPAASKESPAAGRPGSPEQQDRLGDKVTHISRPAAVDRADLLPENRSKLSESL